MARLELPEDHAWIGLDDAERSRLRDFRHQLPETVNRMISERKTKHPAIHKLGSDGAVPVSRIREYYESIVRLAEEAEELSLLVFGHIGEGHPHANIIPSNPEELVRAERAMLDIADLAVRMGGTVSAEHGLGRLKSNLSGIAFLPQELEAMTRIRRTLDPGLLLAPCIEWA